MAWGIAAAGAGALLGGLAGSQGSQQTQSMTRDVGHASALETQSDKAQGTGLADLLRQINMGPGDQDIAAGTDSQRSLAELLKKLQLSGGMPDQNQIDQSAGLAQAMYAPQRQQLQANFQDMSIASDRNAARLGRAGNDPILQNKMYQEQSRQLNQLGAEQGAYARNYAQQLPQQQANYAQQYAGIQGGLASQAMANRQLLLQMGNQVSNSEKNFRVGAGSTTTVNSTPGGFGGFMSGALAGAGAGATAASGFMTPATPPKR